MSAAAEKLLAAALAVQLQACEGAITAAQLQVVPGFAPPVHLPYSTKALKIERARRKMLGSLAMFVRWAWPILNPGTKLVWNWHVEEVCRQYAAFVHGQCAETTLNNQPPGTMKSTIIAQIGPVWGWLHYPEKRWIFASHSLPNSLRDNERRRDLIRDPSFQRIFRPASTRSAFTTVLPGPSMGAPPSIQARPARIPGWAIVKGSDGKGRFVNTRRGSMRATSTGAKITGDHADYIVCDDLLDARDKGGPALKGHVVWYDEALSTRARDGVMRWVNGQRLHEADLSGVLRKRAEESGTLGKAGRGGLDHLVFPHHYAPHDPQRVCISSVGARDNRTEPGVLLWGLRFPEDRLQQIARSMGPLAYAAQYEQDTTVVEGMLFDPTWWGRFVDDPGGGRLYVTVDSSNWSERRGSDLTAITLCRLVNGRLYRLRCWADRYQQPECMDLLLTIHRENPLVFQWLVEDKAGGRGLIQNMIAKGIPATAIVPVNPQRGGGDLLWRADSASPAVRARKCLVRQDAEGDAFIDQCRRFPNVWPDDQIASWVQLAVHPPVLQALGGIKPLDLSLATPTRSPPPKPQRKSAW